MKPTAFILIALTSCLVVGGGRMCAGYKRSDSPKAGPALLADRMETRDSITYTTDPQMEREEKKEEREEKQKEKNSWKMLQNMQFYRPARKPPPSPQPSGNQ